MTNKEMEVNSKILDAIARLQEENERLVAKNKELTAGNDFLAHKMDALVKKAETLKSENARLRGEKPTRSPLTKLYGGAYPWAVHPESVKNDMSRVIRTVCFPKPENKDCNILLSRDMSDEQFERFCEIFGAVCAALAPYADGQ